MRMVTSMLGGGRWIPWLFVGFFGLVLLVNGSMIFVAFSTFPGLETVNAYERGLAYNRQLAAVDEQARLGWQVAFDVTQEEPRHLALQLDLEDRFGNLIQDAVVRARLVRPTHAGADRVVDLPHQTGGRYEADIALPLDGQWDIELAASARGQTYRLSKRVFLRP